MVQVQALAGQVKDIQRLKRSTSILGWQAEKQCSFLLQAPWSRLPYSLNNFCDTPKNTCYISTKTSGQTVDINPVSQFKCELVLSRLGYTCCNLGELEGHCQAVCTVAKEPPGAGLSDLEALFRSTAGLSDGQLGSTGDMGGWGDRKRGHGHHPVGLWRGDRGGQDTQKLRSKRSLQPGSRVSTSVLHGEGQSL